MNELASEEVTQLHNRSISEPSKMEVHKEDNFSFSSQRMQGSRSIGNSPTKRHLSLSTSPARRNTEANTLFDQYLTVSSKLGFPNRSLSIAPQLKADRDIITPDPNTDPQGARILVQKACRVLQKTLGMIDSSAQIPHDHAKAVHFSSPESNTRVIISRDSSIDFQQDTNTQNQVDKEFETFISSHNNINEKPQTHLRVKSMNALEDPTVETVLFDRDRGVFMHPGSSDCNVETLFYDKELKIFFYPDDNRERGPLVVTDKSKQKRQEIVYIDGKVAYDPSISYSKYLDEQYKNENLFSETNLNYASSLQDVPLVDIAKPVIASRKPSRVIAPKITSKLPKKEKSESTGMLHPQPFSSFGKDYKPKVPKPIVKVPKPIPRKSSIAKKAPKRDSVAHDQTQWDQQYSGYNDQQYDQQYYEQPMYDPNQYYPQNYY